VAATVEPDPDGGASEPPPGDAESPRRDGGGNAEPDASARDAAMTDAAADADTNTDADTLADAAADAESTPDMPICPAAGGDYAQAGPYEVATMQVELPVVADGQLSGAATIFHPSPLEDGCAYPIVAWANGTGVEGTATYAFYHQRAASWGIVVIAPHDDLYAEDGGLQRAGIEYLVQQNRDPASVFHRRLSSQAGTAGHAQGAAAAAQATRHTAVVAHIAVEGPASPAEGVAFLCLTGTNGLQECVSTADSATAPSFVASWQNGDHIITPTSSGFDAMNAGTLQFTRLYTAWFRCFLAGDATACALFEGGADCGLCQEQNTRWYALRSRNF
jgi:hypothetical protein